jgi:hypothetical protein
MKTPRLFFTMIVCAALMRGVCHADPPAPASEQSHSESSNATVGNHPNDAKHAASVDDGKHQKEGKPSNGNQDNRHAATNHDQSGPTTAVKQLPPQAPGRQERPDETANNNLPKVPFANAKNFHQSAGPTQTANGGMLKMNDHSRLPAKSTALVPLGETSFNNVRNRGSSPAVIGGAANPIRSTAAINGAGMNHKP